MTAQHDGRSAPDVVSHHSLSSPSEVESEAHALERVGWPRFAETGIGLDREASRKREWLEGMNATQRRGAHEAVRLLSGQERGDLGCLAATPVGKGAQVIQSLPSCPPDGLSVPDDKQAGAPSHQTSVGARTLHYFFWKRTLGKPR
jgi:hypothetical protein